MTATRTLLARPKRAEPIPPKHLEPPERELWRGLLATFRLEDVASLSLLTTALEGHQRARRCREQVDRDGETVRDRFGQVKPHPLLTAERDARAAYLAAMRALNLDIGEPK